MSTCLSCGNDRPCCCGPPPFIPSAYQQPEEPNLHPSTKWANRFLESHAMPTDTEIMRHYLKVAFNAGAQEAIHDVIEVCDLWVD